MKAREAAASSLISIALAVLVYGAVLGFWPIKVGNTSYLSTGFNCGSAFITGGDLTDAGHVSCEIGAGAAGRRVHAVALLASGVALLLLGYVQKMDARSDSAPPKS